MKSIVDNNLRVLRSRGGFTLIELLVAVSIIVLVGTIAVFGLGKVLTAQSESAARLSIRAALARAQAHALANNRPAGVRFQFDKEGWRLGRQYLVVVEQAQDAYAPDLFTAVADTQPIALPVGVGVLALTFDRDGSDRDSDGRLEDDEDLEENIIAPLTNIIPGHDDQFLMDALTFTVVFGANGNLSLQDVFVRRRSDQFDSNPNMRVNTDPIFNEVFDSSNDQDLDKIVEKMGEAPLLFHDWHQFPALQGFYQPDSSERRVPWCDWEKSQLGFYIFDISELREVDPDRRYEQYFQQKQPLYVNYYTGGIIEEPSLGLGE